MKSASGSSRYCAEPIAAPAALGHEPQRQPHQRAERRLHRAQEHRGAAEEEQRERRHRRGSCVRGASRSISPSTKPALPAQAALEPGHPAAVALVIVAKQVQQAVQRQHPQLGGQRVARPRGPGGRATPAAITTSPSWPGSSGRKRQHVGRRVLSAKSAVQRAHARVGGTSDGHAARAPAPAPPPRSQRAQARARRAGTPTHLDASSGRASTHRRRAGRRVGVVGLDDLLHQLVADDVRVVEVDEADALDVLHDLAAPRPGPTRCGFGRSICVMSPVTTAFEPKPEPRQEHLHLLRRGVLRLVEDDERVVQRAPAHEGDRRHLDGAALDQPRRLLGVHHVVERVVERAQVRVHLLLQVAGQEARASRRPRPPAAPG